MKKTITALALVLAVWCVHAKPVCIGETCYLSEEAAIAAGHSPEEVKAALAGHGGGATAGERAPGAAASAGQETSTTGREQEIGVPSKGRLAMGYMKPAEFIAFLKNRPAERSLEDHSLLVILLLVLLGGLAANLTPCVLPLVPINLVLVGRGWRRGAAYGLGIALAYGALGIAAALGGMAFGTIQSSPWFSLLVAGVFTVLGLAMSELFFIDFSKYRGKVVGGKGGTRSLGGVFLLGVGAAVLAGACVEPILLATLLLTAKWFAAGKVWSVVLPFILGLGMGLPWPFAAAGLSVLPKPGPWMKWVNRVFALSFFCMAAWSGRLAWKGFQGMCAVDRSAPMGDAPVSGALEATPETFAQVHAVARRRNGPVVIDIWATWCKNCLAMEKTTFRDPGVLKALKDGGFVLIRLQAENPAELARIEAIKDLDIRGLPAFVVLP